MPRNTREEFGPAYGLIAGAALGALLLAFTGSVWWIIFLPGLGLVIGQLVSGASGRTSGHSRR